MFIGNTAQKLYRRTRIFVKRQKSNFNPALCVKLMKFHTKNMRHIFRLYFYAGGIVGSNNHSSQCLRYSNLLIFVLSLKDKKSLVFVTACGACWVFTHVCPKFPLQIELKSQSKKIRSSHLNLILFVIEFQFSIDEWFFAGLMTLFFIKPASKWGKANKR